MYDDVLNLFKELVLRWNAFDTQSESKAARIRIKNLFMAAIWN
jgi:hypothetical protein